MLVTVNPELPCEDFFDYAGETTWQLRVYSDKHSKGEEEKVTRFLKSWGQDCYCAQLFNGDIDQYRINSKVCALDSLVYWGLYIGE